MRQWTDRTKAVIAPAPWRPFSRVWFFLLSAPYSKWNQHFARLSAVSFVSAEYPGGWIPAVPSPEQVLPSALSAFSWKGSSHHGYTIGGTIIFPKHPGSINQAKGTNAKISDSWDLTLECIRRHYAGEESPLSKAMESDREFFDLFLDFRGYVDYFFLQDCVTEDYSEIRYWIGKGDFTKNALPQSVDEYMLWLQRQSDFLNRRNARIKEYALANGI